MLTNLTILKVRILPKRSFQEVQLANSRPFRFFTPKAINQQLRLVNLLTIPPSLSLFAGYSRLFCITKISMLLKLSTFTNAAGAIGLITVLGVPLSLTLAASQKSPFKVVAILSGSMEPTLQIGDQVRVNTSIYRTHKPQRGDIVMFGLPKTLRYQGYYEEAFIKRIIGLPGDRVMVTDDRVTINGQPLSESYKSTENSSVMQALYAKRNEIDPNFPTWDGTARGPNWRGNVPRNQYLVLGDHRSASIDSRSFGFVSHTLIIGKITTRTKPADRAGTISQPNYRSQRP
jgi:signal peptidase I